MNPYYNPKECGLEMLCFDQPDLSYAYDTLCFWATPTGQIYTSEDSGCSCPTPFDRHDQPTTEAVIQTLERIGSIEQAEAAFDSWNASYIPGQAKVPTSERNELTLWIKERLKP